MRQDRDPDQHALAPVPEYRNYLVYCDEGSIDGQRYYGWGTVWIPAEARGRLTGLFTALLDTSFMSGDEVKWTKVNSRTYHFFEALLDAFFRKSWILFHCLVMDTHIVRTELFDGGLVEARIHHLSTLLRNKIAYLSSTGTPKIYHVRVDPLPSSYPKEDEKLWKITDAMLAKEVGERRIATLYTRDSKEVRGIQLADFLLGALLSPWNGRNAPGSPKAKMSSLLYKYLGWGDHLADTKREELKFNIWHFHDRTRGPRPVRARPVRLIHPFRAYRA